MGNELALRQPKKILGSKPVSLADHKKATELISIFKSWWFYIKPVWTLYGAMRAVGVVRCEVQLLI